MFGTSTVTSPGDRSGCRPGPDWFDAYFQRKVLADLGGRPLLRFMLDRLEGLQVDQLIVATSDRPDDDRVEAIAQGAGVGCVRGPEDDVLARFALALRSNPGRHRR